MISFETFADNLSSYGVFVLLKCPTAAREPSLLCSHEKKETTSNYGSARCEVDPLFDVAIEMQLLL